MVRFEDFSLGGGGSSNAVECGVGGEDVSTHERAFKLRPERSFALSRPWL
jgi:hypothetical protein